VYRQNADNIAISVLQGQRTCDFYTDICEANRAGGGWGTASLTGFQPIPNRNVYIYNNIIFSPRGAPASRYVFRVGEPLTPDASSNIPSPSATDDELRIRGNVIWSETAAELGINSGTGCGAANASCNQSQLTTDNTINTLEPALNWTAETAELRPAAGSWLFSATVFPLPDFPAADALPSPAAPRGILENSVMRDRFGATRNSAAPPGAYATAQ
jgi:hypothetical protein